VFVGKRSIKETLEYTHTEESEEMKHNRVQTLILGNNSKNAVAENRTSEQQDKPGQLMIVERKKTFLVARWIPVTIPRGIVRALP